MAKRGAINPGMKARHTGIIKNRSSDFRLYNLPTGKTRDLTKSYETNISYKSFGFTNGMMFNGWVDSRTNGYNVGDLIRNPAYIAESILRDWVFRENDLTITTVSSTTQFVITNLLNASDDYYNNAEIFNVTRNESDLISDYTGSTKTITTTNTHASWSGSDKLYVSNIQGTRINTTSFDVIGNTTNGTRDDWYFDFPIYQSQNASALLSAIAFESHCAIVESAGQFRMIALDSDSIATWTNPMNINGVPGLSAGYLDTGSLYTDFTFNYGYSVPQERFTQKLFCSPAGLSSGITSGYSTLCQTTRANYKVERKFNYDSYLIQDETTAILLFQRLMTYLTTLKHYITFYASPKTHIQYEVGDIVKINNSALMPSGLNNSAKYMIVNKTFQYKQLGDSTIIFTLMQTL